MTILIVEDEAQVAHYIKKGLEAGHYTVDVAYDGEKALNKVEVNDYDLIILDILLPQMDGLEVCKKIREKKIHTPILILTACETIEDRVKGLDVGADDYITKPFAFAELQARMRALLRREKTTRVPKLQVGDLVMDPASYEVWRGDRKIYLSSKEYRLLDYMMRRPGRVCTRNMLGEHVWGYNFIPRSNVINSFVSHLRKKIDKGHANKLIHTVRDVGYKIQDGGNPFKKKKRAKEMAP